MGGSFRLCVIASMRPRSSERKSTSFNKAVTSLCHELSIDIQPSVVVHYLNFVRVPIVAEKAEPPTIIDPYAMSALAVALQRFQPIAPNRAKVRQTGRA